MSSPSPPHRASNSERLLFFFSTAANDTAIWSCGKLEARAPGRAAPGEPCPGGRGRQSAADCLHTGMHPPTSLEPHRRPSWSRLAETRQRASGALPRATVVCSSRAPSCRFGRPSRRIFVHRSPLQNTFESETPNTAPISNFAAMRPGSPPTTGRVRELYFALSSSVSSCCKKVKNQDDIGQNVQTLVKEPKRRCVYFLYILYDVQL